MFFSALRQFDSSGQYPSICARSRMSAGSVPATVAAPQDTHVLLNVWCQGPGSADVAQWKSAT